METFSSHLATPVLPGYNHAPTNVGQSHTCSSSNNRNLNLGVELKSSAHSIDRKALGIHSETPKFPQYSSVDSRLQTYINWPSDVEQTPEVLAAAGLFYSGCDDMVRCYFCGGGLKSWDPPDDPWEEHERWYPNCPHIKLNKSVAAQKPDSAISEYDYKKHDPEGCAELENVLLQSIAAQSLLINGIKERTIKRAVTILRQRKGVSFDADIKAEDLMKIVFELEDNDSLDGSETEMQIHKSYKVKTPGSDSPSTEETNVASKEDTFGHTDSPDEMKEDLLEENRQLKQNLMCKICLDNMACIIFLPCGHMVSCPQCAPAMKKCPICRQHIRGSVKAYLS